MLGGDHSLKFGVGWRTQSDPDLLALQRRRARRACSASATRAANCGDGAYVAGRLGHRRRAVPGASSIATSSLNNDWWTYNGYIQDGFSRGRWRLNGGLRYDWQQSKCLGGCVPANALRPDLLPAQCEEATDDRPVTGKKIQPFGNWSPRVSATYDLFGNGKTQVHASGSYFYDTKITLANALGGLVHADPLTLGTEPSSGACSTTAERRAGPTPTCDGLVQVNELIGTPTVEQHALR